jgi:hypothetical protein
MAKRNKDTMATLEPPQALARVPNIRAGKLVRVIIWRYSPRSASQARVYEHKTRYRFYCTYDEYQERD